MMQTYNHGTDGLDTRLFWEVLHEHSDPQTPDVATEMPH